MIAVAPRWGMCGASLEDCRRPSTSSTRRIRRRMRSTDAGRGLPACINLMVSNSIAIAVCGIFGARKRAESRKLREVSDAACRGDRGAGGS